MIRTSVRSSDGLRLVRKTAICGGAKDQSEDGGSNKAAESINIILLFIVCRMKVTVKDSSETGCVNCVVIRKRERETDTVRRKPQVTFFNTILKNTRTLRCLK